MSGGIGQPPGGGFMDGLGQFFRDNSGSMMGLGMGLMQGDMGTAMQGYAQGERQDQVRRMQVMKTEEERQKKAWAQSMADKLGRPELGGNPELVQALALDKYKTREPKEHGIEEIYLRRLAKADPAKFTTLMESKFGGGSSQPNEVKEYQFDMSQRQATGQPTVPYSEWQIQKKGNENKVLAGDRKVIYGAEDENLNLDATIGALQQAKELNKEAFSGAGAGFRGTVGSKLPDWMVPDVYADKKGADKTAEFGKIMSMESITKMADTLKGATTDFELNKFVEILADPSTPAPIRERTIDRMLALSERKKKLNNERINEISGGTYFKSRAAGGGQNQQQPSAAQAIQVDGYTIRQR